MSTLSFSCISLLIIPSFLARLSSCKTRKYLSNLPTTSVVVIFFNENWNLLLRCLHSIYNRTPHKLLHEIILISDKSTDDRLGKPLARYVKENFGDIVKFFINDERKGLIVTRMEGARKATGEVIVFLDSHMEVNVNWLPPLLEPIALNSHTACVPIIDSFSPYTLEYQTLGQGSRGSFDWTMTYQWLPLTKKYQKNVGDVYQLSAMTGGAYAINRNFFFKLGGYDEGLMVWNGENYELSFKLHLCGGNLVQVSEIKLQLSFLIAHSLTNNRCLAHGSHIQPSTAPSIVNKITALTLVPET